MFMSLSDATVLEQFESGTLPADELGHVSHLRIAWLYLNTLALQDAIEKIATGTKDYAECLGIYDKYHRTITEAIARIMYKRMNSLNNESFELFIENNRDLVDDLKSLLYFHYSKETLESLEARLHFIQPDKEAVV